MSFGLWTRFAIGAIEGTAVVAPNYIVFTPPAGAN